MSSLSSELWMKRFNRLLCGGPPVCHNFDLISSYVFSQLNIWDAVYISEIQCYRTFISFISFSDTSLYLYCIIQISKSFLFLVAIYWILQKPDAWFKYWIMFSLFANELQNPHINPSVTACIIVPCWGCYLYCTL